MFVIKYYSNMGCGKSKGKKDKQDEQNSGAGLRVKGTGAEA